MARSPSSTFYFGRLAVLCHSFRPLDIFKRFQTRRHGRPLSRVESPCAAYKRGPAIFSSVAPRAELSLILVTHGS